MRWPAWMQTSCKKFFVVLLIVLYGALSLGNFLRQSPVKIAAVLPDLRVVTPKDLGPPRWSFVNPFIGTGGHGHTFPGATVPFGMVQVSPSSGNKQWDWCSGYHYSDSKVISFGHLHLSGTGIGDGFDISLFPMTRDGIQEDYYEHADEEASPGYYRVRLKSGIEVELTATNRTGMHRYTFPDNSTHMVNLNLGYGFDEVASTSLEVLNTTHVKGLRRSRGWAKNHDVHFALVFSCPFTTVKCGGAQHDRGMNCQGAQALFTFAASCQVLITKVGLSSASVEGATKSLSEAPHFDFDRVRAEAEQSWEKELSMVELEGDKDDQITFYSALYHLKLAPTLHSDLLGMFHGPGDQNRKADFDFYSTFSIWDTFRAAHPLHILLSHDRINDMLKSMMLHYNLTGVLPVWSLYGQETNTMPGYHAVSILTESILKGFDPGVSNEAVLQAMVTSAGRFNRAVGYGFVPQGPECVTSTLEFAYDDYCISEMAKLVHDDSVQKAYFNRSGYWKNVFDVNTGFMRAKTTTGEWVTPFNPLSFGPGSEYTEGTAWQHIWFVPHAVEQFVTAFGGPDKFEKRLDEFFHHDNKGFNSAMDVTGMIGQYAHGNEPSHHIAYLYNYVGRRDKTQKWVREILQRFYSNSPDGLSGNEDCGQMSAWFLFSAMGLYPVNPVSLRYDLGSPLFKKVVLKLVNTTFTISAPLTSKHNVLVESVRLNGKTLDRAYITHAEIMQGGELEFVMIENSSNSSELGEKDKH